MSVAQACEILGVKAAASEQEIRAAYSGLMKRLHPDVGGSEFLSKQLNAARDALQEYRSTAKSGRSSPWMAEVRPTSSLVPAKVIGWTLVAFAGALVCFVFAFGP
jgi:hypothetical protein